MFLDFSFLNESLTENLNSHTHDASDITSGELPIFKGGTGASMRSDAINNLMFLGVNPITNTTNDTITNWCSLGIGYAFYSMSDLLIDQPQQYGYLLNFTYGAKEVFQIWNSMPSSALYVRSGNASGWANSWKKIAFVS